MRVIHAFYAKSKQLVEILPIAVDIRAALEILLIYAVPNLRNLVLNFGRHLKVVDTNSALAVKVQVTGGHPSKRTYQALRIELNHELDVLQDNLDTMIDLLKNEGRICIITFHSLEDRIVKSNFKKNDNPCTCPSNFPVCVCGNKSKGHVVSRKPILPSDEELEKNTRSKSAKLRVFEKEEA